MLTKWNLAGILIIMLCGSTTVLSATQDIKGDVLEFGYYQAFDELARSKNLSSPSGYIRKGGSVQLVKQSVEIPNIQGLLFGFQFRLSGYAKTLDQAWLRLVVKHPLMIRPNGSRAEGYSYPISLRVSNGVIEDKSGYKLDKKFEMVEGEWVFQYWDKEKVLIEQKFIVRAPTKADQKLILAVKQNMAKNIELQQKEQPESKK